MNVQITDAIEARLKIIAKKNGMTVDQVATQLLVEQLGKIDRRSRCRQNTKLVKFRIVK